MYRNLKDVPQKVSANLRICVRKVCVCVGASFNVCICKMASLTRYILHCSLSLFPFSTFFIFSFHFSCSKIALLDASLLSQSSSVTWIYINIYVYISFYVYVYILLAKRLTSSCLFDCVGASLVT